MLLTLSRSSSPYPVSLYLFKGFLSTSVMLFILKHGLWGDLTFSFHLNNWETKIILLKIIKRKGQGNRGRCCGIWHPLFWWDKTSHLLSCISIVLQLLGYNSGCPSLMQLCCLPGEQAGSRTLVSHGGGLIQHLAAVLHLCSDGCSHQHSSARDQAVNKI